MTNTIHTSRRNFLRGAGVALALPWLESLPVLAQDGKAAGSKPPLRFAHLFFSNGVEPIHWWAKGSGAAMEFGKAAEPLAPIREDIVFLRGLYHQKAFVSTSPHLGRMNLLSGQPVSLDPKEIRVGTSFDQVLAARIGNRTAVPSLVLGIEPNELRLEDGLSMIYGSNISWVSPSKPATKEIYPSRTFDQLVGDPKGRQLDRSILDGVLAEAHSLQPKVSTGDRRKLDEYLESIRDIEKRLDHAAKEERLEGWKPSLTQPNMQRPGEQLPQNVPEHMKLMLDLIVLAFQMDKTRLATLMLNNDLSQMNFRFIEGVRGALHLDLTHNGKAVEAEAMYLKTNQFHIQQFAYLAQRLKAIDEGGTSLLDNSVLMLASSLFDGDAHGADQLPIVLAGKAGGALQTGRILDYLDKGNDNRRACSLFLSLMDVMGVQLDRFGDADKRLTGLLAG
ncbi:MAG TPA: DUF1552 domain-containing protein [Blastocatellia bacterium]|nr:DUF1552 domain-containing protein [Blastocatellia bacterium]HMV81540.1 DUF1552 domain-containing protein [Blastocatellia bacterium]HMZ17667.1 DUF1552 domain-containing protein [Blastocatellia bacterium]HNG28529.1 DUF1552 domain-containing protein [Blastocatellia bacterium]